MSEIITDLLTLDIALIQQRTRLQSLAFCDWKKNESRMLFALQTRFCPGLVERGNISQRKDCTGSK